ncbi:UDP-N-acetylmuramate dehydrogenase [Effusibacillus lacus]|uniref:UDP-N-acetylenolpyruvoylglucosamine reductase n=1 Tax=Effusibacillus lacus TaxID=1348429 RepID=A0A292YR84_9BACL|nr:UDP-N-acetylmuramate dehydrogenase [Effusibacillus lacus]TCS75684.1 UDP-N-acetylmuramate dehydrogenase [Effusibacillus lacus]GAX91005.1 UDP-N-acetylenolpyruvoylglucosamine reductase [Effusibacillus lacus]
MSSNDWQSIFHGLDLGTILFDEPLSRHTTWKIGGPADVFVIPTKVEHLQALARICAEHHIPWYVIGRGSNLLVRDGGMRGVVIKLADNFADLSVDGSTNQLTAQAGRSYVSAANTAIRNGLQGLEFATGIPGTVGGAVMMNAGAHGGETREVLLSAEIVEEDGSLVTLQNHDLQFAYRYSILKDHPRIVVRATFQLRPGNTEEMQAKVRNWTKRRQTTQPLQLPNCGSVFRNPEGTHAGLLIEQAGLKGTRIGGAQISDLHANFIVNIDKAQASDVLALIELAQTTVRNRYGVSLIPEVRIVGED